MDFRLPELGEGVYEAELVAWLVKPGDVVTRGQNLVEVMTDKATMEVPSPFAGTITALHAQPGEQIKVGAKMLAFTGAELAGQQPDRSVRAIKADQDPAQGDAKQLRKNAAKRQAKAPEKVLAINASSAAAVKAAPSVRYMARKLGVDLADVIGSGPDGRVLIEDLSSHVKSTNGDNQRTRKADLSLSYGEPGTRIKMIGLRRKIAEHMVLAKKTIPHYSYVDECEVSELVRLRESLREPFAAVGLKLTYLAFFVKAVALALRDIPIVNASLDDENEEIVLHDRYDVGIAVATPQGLMVPVVRDVDKKDLAQITREIERLSSEARARKTRLEDLRGGTFTITSIGGIGGLISTPVINHPEVAILGVGTIVKRPIYEPSGTLRPADMLYLSFSFDHRVIDGAVGAAFGNAVKSRLENPARLLLKDPLV